MNIQISVIIPFNNYPVFEKCVKHLRQSTFKNYEIIGVANISKDSSRKIIKTNYTKVIIINKNYGVGYSRNLGVKFAKGKIITYLDSDTLIQKNALTKIYKCFSDKDVNVLQGVYTHFFNYKNIFTNFLQSYIYFYVFNPKIKFTRTLVTHLISIRKNIFFLLGGFNNKSKIYVYDEELGYNLLKKKIKIKIRQDIKALHDININFIQFVKRTFFMHVAHTKLFLRKKSFMLKINQKNYNSIFFSIILVFILILASIIKIIFDYDNYYYLLNLINLSFLIVNFPYLRFLYKKRSFIFCVQIYPIIYLHRFLMILSLFCGLFSFFILNKKY
jgi:glycosyltransferase involved in cell wall biosynthesis